MIEKGDKTVLKCSNCDMELIEVVYMDPAVDVETILKATCPCGDFSYPKKVAGRFSYATPGIKVGNTEVVNLYIEQVSEEKDMVVFDVRKK